MPVGDPGGPDSEVFFRFPQVAHDPRFGRHPHQNSDGGSTSRSATRCSCSTAGHPRASPSCRTTTSTSAADSNASPPPRSTARTSTASTACGRS
jgi:hypothetical protein